MKMKTKRLSLDEIDLKLADEGMKFSGYASVFNGVDSYGDTIAPGAYAKTLVGRSRPVRMRWNHFGPVIGKWVSLVEDEKGLRVEGELTPGHSTAEDVYASMKHGAIDGLSIGYRPEKSESLGEGRTLLKEINLIEVSVVEEPADLSARIGDVKSMLDQATSLKEIEAVLRDAGWSRADATALVSRIKALGHGDRESEAIDAESIRRLFQRFRVE